MGTKFTKGPWVKDKRNENLVGGDGKNVAIWGCGLTNAYKSELTEANASLIAAAPDMYEMLYYIMKGEIRAYAHEERINKLLAKARGE